VVDSTSGDAIQSQLISLMKACVLIFPMRMAIESEIFVGDVWNQLLLKIQLEDGHLQHSWYWWREQIE
jgi:hypothetical protein